MREKPVLFVDIDGVISLWGMDSNARPDGVLHNVDGVMHFLSAASGIHLLALSGAFELVWCSGWEEKADEYLPRVLDLPIRPPFLSFDRNPGRGLGHWKLAAIDDFAGPDRALAWIDDAHNDACHDWAQRRPAPTLLVATTPATGLLQAHVTQLLAWSEAIAEGGAETARARAGGGG